VTTWIFRARTDCVDVNTYLRDGMVVPWLVAKQAHARQVEIGDRVYIWRVQGRKRAPRAGIIANGRITGLPQERPGEQEALAPWVDVKDADSALRVELEIDRVAAPEEVLTRVVLLVDPMLRDLLCFRMAQETNWPLKPEHAARLEELWTRTKQPGP